MAMSNMDAATRKSLMDRALAVDGWLGRVCGTEAQQKANVQAAAQGLYDAHLRAALQKMEIEHINRAKQGIRISVLREAGVENVWQISQMGYQQICDLDGIGEQTAQKIQDTVQQIVENTKGSLRVRIRAEEKQAEDTALVMALYKMMHHGALRKAFMEIYQEHHTAVQSECALVREGMNSFSWLFKSRVKKDSILQAAQRLQQRLNGPFGNGELQKAWYQVESTAPEVCWEDYTKNASAYYAELERIGLNWNREKTGPGDLPAQLAAEIEAQELDLTDLKATLRSYQTFGTKYIVHQKRTLLGDEMGLGKTMQAIASMVALKAAGQHHFMVVCPASVLVNWCREVQKFSTLQVTKIHGNDEEALMHWRMNGDVAVTTFESISRFELPEKFRIGMVITDEAHYVKNPETQRTKALLKLLNRTEYALFMSGTPLENRVEEMCFLISCLQPEIAQQLEGVKYISTAEQFRRQLAPVYLRRTRDDVLQELPELVEKEQWCVLGKQEMQDYRDAVMSGNFMAIRQVSWQTDEMKNSSKAMRLLEICEQAKEQKRKVIVFSFFRATIRRVMELLGDRCLEPISGEISPQRRQEIVDEFGKAPDGAVLVSQVQAGGTGLYIQSASVIIFCEPQIKPSIENQAIARAYRMGQVRDVLVYRLLADDTVDEQIMEILKSKQNLFDNFADESAVGMEALKQAEQNWINKMVEAEQERLKQEEKTEDAQ